MEILEWIFLTPLAIIGGINFFRGIGAVVEMDEAKFGHKIKTNSWKFYLYMLLLYGGYFSLFYMIIKYI